MKKYKNFKIENTPSEGFPEMVTVTKGKKINKRFINEKKAIIWIDENLTIMLIEKGKRKINDELDSVGLLSFTDEY